MFPEQLVPLPQAFIKTNSPSPVLKVASFPYYCSLLIVLFSLFFAQNKDRDQENGNGLHPAIGSRKQLMSICGRVIVPGCCFLLLVFLDGLLQQFATRDSIKDINLVQ